MFFELKLDLLYTWGVAPSMTMGLSVCKPYVWVLYISLALRTLRRVCVQSISFDVDSEYTASDVMPCETPDDVHVLNIIFCLQSFQYKGLSFFWEGGSQIYRKLA